MTKLLDLVREFASLHEERWRNGGLLPPPREERFWELARLCDRVLSSKGVGGRGRGGGWTRASLRVPAELDIIFQHRREYHTGQLVNLSRGGLFLGSAVLLSVGSPLVVFLTNVGREALLEVRAEVVWTSEAGITGCGLPRGMGVRFVDFSEPLARQLEGFVYETLERRLAYLDRAALDRAAG